MQVKGHAIPPRTRVGKSELTAPAKKAAAKPTRPPRAKLTAPDPEQSVAKGTAHAFVKSATGPKSGQSPLALRIATLQHPAGAASDGALDLRGYRSDDAGKQALRKLLGASSAGVKSYAEIFKEQNPELQKIAEEDLAALLVYSMETVPKLGYRDINEALRDGPAASYRRLAPIARATASALNRLKPHQGPVFRGAAISLAALARYQESVGQRLEPERPFTSTSLDQSVARRFAKERAAGSGKEPVLFKIQDKGAGRQLPFSRYPGEKEVLFPPGATFQVDKVEKKGGLTVVSLSEVD